MSTNDGGSNGNGALVQLAEIKGARERVPLGHLLTAVGILVAFIVYFESRIGGLDEALQREARDLDRTLDVQIQHVKEVEAMNSQRFIDFIYAMREWQLAIIEQSAYHRGQADARLSALEKQSP